jgi:hypothetical protein
MMRGAIVSLPGLFLAAGVCAQDVDNGEETEMGVRYGEAKEALFSQEGKRTRRLPNISPEPALCGG